MFLFVFMHFQLFALLYATTEILLNKSDSDMVYQIMPAA
jgi:hypothetical protein